MTVVDERLQSRVIELRILMSILWKSSEHALNQWLVAHDAEVPRLQFGILRVLAHEGSHTISELSRKFGLDPSTFVPSVDALERKGMISRERDPNDRRRVPLSLTDAGRDLLAQIPKIADFDPMGPALAELGDDFSVQLLTMLCQLVHQIPDGAGLIADSESRMYAHGAKEDYRICKPHDE